MSNTDLSDMSIAGTCDILVYQMRHKVMGFIRLVDLRNRFALPVICCLIYHWLEVRC